MYWISGLNLTRKAQEFASSLTRNVSRKGPKTWRIEMEQTGEFFLNYNKKITFFDVNVKGP